MVHLLRRVDRKLNVVLKEEGMILADQAALDVAIANLGSAVDAVVAKLNELEVPVDFTAEVDALKASTDEITAALAPPAETTEPTS